MTCECCGIKCATLNICPLCFEALAIDTARSGTIYCSIHGASITTQRDD